MKEIYDFLKQLDANNTREWFDAHRDEYKNTQQKFLYITEVLINEIRSFDSEIPYLDPKKCVFRIFRDVRFSNDKRPYKNNFGTFIARDGRKGGNPGYYLHIQPGESFLSGGIYMPDAEKLKAIRTEIYNHPDEFIELLDEPTFKQNFGLYSDDKLKTSPRDFPADFEHIDLLRYKSYAPHKAISEQQLLAPDFIDFVVGHFRLIAPFNRYLNFAINQR
jgi:uncharacterized protein (TIGR02453 family)